MAIKAKIPTGQSDVRTSVMYQWDYGQTLEIEADDLPACMEVHFACNGMTEAVVHTCEAVDQESGVRTATVAIPDRCLEQASEITAWVYEFVKVDDVKTAGRTIYKITIPMAARMRPARSESVPQAVQDTYTQLIATVNSLIESLQIGGVNVGYAAEAGHAATATKATSADSATSAGTAGSANKAVNDGDGNKISDTYLKIPDDFAPCSAGTVLETGLYVFRVFMAGDSSADMHTLLVQTGGMIAEYVYSTVFSFKKQLHRLSFGNGSTDGATYTGVQYWDEESGAWVDATFTGAAYYKKLTD